MPLQASTASKPRKTKRAGIRLQRRRDRFGILRSMKVFIDGERQGGLSYGQSRLLRLAPGTHTVRVSMDWYSCKPYEVEVPEEGYARLECGCRRTGLLNFLLLGILSRPSGLFEVVPAS